MVFFLISVVLKMSLPFTTTKRLIGKCSPPKWGITLRNNMCDSESKDSTEKRNERNKQNATDSWASVWKEGSLGCQCLRLKSADRK